MASSSAWRRAEWLTVGVRVPTRLKINLRCPVLGRARPQHYEHRRPAGAVSLNPEQRLDRNEPQPALPAGAEASASTTMCAPPAASPAATSTTARDRAVSTESGAPGAGSGRAIRGDWSSEPVVGGSLDQLSRRNMPTWPRSSNVRTGFADHKRSEAAPYCPGLPRPLRRPTIRHLPCPPRASRATRASRRAP